MSRLEEAARAVVFAWKVLLHPPDPFVVRTVEEAESARTRFDFAMSLLEQALNDQPTPGGEA